MASISTSTTRPTTPVFPQTVTVTDGVVLRRPLPPRLGGVVIVRWPAEGERREEQAARHEPCLLVVEADEPPPAVALLEDWVRDPVDWAELEARCAALQARAVCGHPPVLDDGLLVHRGAWAAIPPGQVAIAALLVEQFGAVVTREQLVDAARACGASVNGEAVKTTMTRLGRRVAPLGLALRTIRGRGYLLEVAGACPVHGSRSAATATATDP